MLNYRSVLRICLTVTLFIVTSATQAQPKLEVTIEGVDGELLENVRLLLGIEQQKDSEVLVEGRIHRLHQKAPEEIHHALEPFGYYRAEVESSLSVNNGVWKAHYRIEPGQQIPIGDNDIVLSGEASASREFTDLIRDNPLKLNAPFIHADYEAFKQALRQLAVKSGYFDARFTQHEVRVDLVSYRAAISLHFDSGPRYRFGDVNFVGEHPFDVDFLSRYPEFSPGDYYQQTLLAELQKRLAASDYFEAVDIQTTRNAGPPPFVTVTVHLQQRPRNRYQFGFGYGSDTGVRGKLGYDRRWLNATGHRLSTEMRLSEIQNSLAAVHSVPLSRPATDRLVTQARYQLDRGGDVDSRQLRIGTGVERARGAWVRQWGLSYQLEDFEIGLQNGESELLIPSVRWTSIHGYDSLFLLRSVNLGIELRGASSQFVSDTDFLQLRLDVKALLPVGQGRFILRGEAGATAVDSISQLPPSLRFFAGGDYSIRGYAYRSVGPVDGSGEVVGGRNLLVGSVEYEHPLNDKWSVALFLDGGNAFDGEFVEAEKGAGLGMRRSLPIGQLRVDLAQAITEDDRPWRLHLTMGLQF